MKVAAYGPFGIARPFLLLRPHPIRPNTVLTASRSHTGAHFPDPPSSAWLHEGGLCADSGGKHTPAGPSTGRTVHPSAQHNRQAPW
eukprot:scaffold287828_cov33-Tisochrysis_lutea.AAC.2